MNKSRLSIVTIALALVAMLFSCENDIEVVNSITDPNVIPELAGTDVEILYSDSAKIKIKIVAPQLNRFKKSDNKPYLEFPIGMHVYFYDDSMGVKAEISAKYAIYKETMRLWEARNNVVVVNVEGDKLNTEQLFWDENKEIIYTDKFAKITTPDGEVHIGHKGLTARQDFSNWKLKGYSGSGKFRDEEN